MFPRFLTITIGAACLLPALAFVGCDRGDKSQPAGGAGTAPKEGELVAPLNNLPLGLDKEELIIPEDNPLTGPAGAAKVELGRHLYFDKRLSKDKSISCASCHDPDKGWSNGEQFATGVDGKKGGANSPTIINRVFSRAQFWDGRAKSLEEQALGPVGNPIEMAMNSLDEVIERLNEVDGYKPLFKNAFGDEKITSERIAKAIASFERTIVSGNSPYDRYQAGDKSAMSASAVNGMKIFFDNNKGRCSICHAGFNFTDEAYHNLGVGTDQPDWETKHAGRFSQTKQDKHKGAFKTPTLRNVTETAPYMHDGSEGTLESVVELYVKGGKKNPYLDKEMRPLELTEQEKKDLVEFMKALAGEVTQVTAPEQLQ